MRRILARLRGLTGLAGRAFRCTRGGNRCDRGQARPQAVAAGGGILQGPRRVALVLIAGLVTGASLVSFAESYRGLWVWALHHDLSGVWAAAFPAQIDVFIAVGELALFVALVDQWAPRSRWAAWLVTVAGLAVSVGGNIGHVAGHSLSVRATAAVPPLAASSALAIGLGVLKRIVEHRQAPRPGGAVSSPVPPDVEAAAIASLRATFAAGNPWSLNQLAERFALTRAQATRLRSLVAAEQNGHTAAGNVAGGAQNSP